MKVVFFKERECGKYDFRVRYKGCTYSGVLGEDNFRSKFWKLKDFEDIVNGGSMRMLSHRKCQVLSHRSGDHLCIETFFRKNEDMEEIKETNKIPVKFLSCINKIVSSKHARLPTEEISGEGPEKKKKNLESKAEEPGREDQGKTLPAADGKHIEITKRLHELETGMSEIRDSIESLKDHEIRPLAEHTICKDLETIAEIASLRTKTEADIADFRAKNEAEISELKKNAILLKQELDHCKSENIYLRHLSLVYSHAVPFECHFFYNTPRRERSRYEVVINPVGRLESEFFEFLMLHPRFQVFSDFFNKSRNSKEHSVFLRNVPRDCEILFKPIEVFKYGRLGQVLDFYTRKDPSLPESVKCSVDFLMTLYEINLEFSLFGKLLLPGGASFVTKKNYERFSSGEVSFYHTFDLKSDAVEKPSSSVSTAEKKIWSDKLGFFDCVFES